MEADMLLKEGDRRTIGSKAFDLYRCVLMGVRVPDLVVVPTRYHARSEEREAVSGLRKELERAFSELGGVVAVRSSSVAEDLDGTSNAGQFRTVLGVDSYPALEDALVEVWASSKDHPMAVIIQRMLRPDISGVLFTRDPVTGSNTTIIEHVEGLAETLVSGQRDPTRLEVSNDLVDMPDDQFEELVRTARNLEEGFGYPLDIEWAMCEEGLYILQARPITNLPPPDRTAGPSYTRVHAEEFFSGPVTPLFHSFFGDLYSKYYIGETLKTLGVKIPVDYPVLVRHKNYLYADTRLNEYTYSRLPSGIGKKRLEAVLPPDVLEHLERNKGMTNPSGILRIIKFLLFNPRFWRSRLDIHFREDVVPELIARLDRIGEFRDMSTKELMLAHEELIDITILHIRVSKWGLALYSIPLSDGMERFLSKHGIEEDKFSLLMTGLDDNRTLDASNELQGLAAMIKANTKAMDVVKEDHPDYPAYRKRLADVPNGDLLVAHFESILVRYGHRRLSRDLISPSWSDDPMIPFGIVRSLVNENGQRPMSDGRRHVERRIATQHDIEKRLPLAKRGRFRTLSRYMARYLSFRELQRFYLDMIVSRMRGLILEISRRMVEDGLIDDIDDVFFLEMSDILGFLNGMSGTGLMKKVLFNRLTHEDQTRTPGRYMRLGVDFDSIEKQEEGSISGHSIKGQSVSPGTYSGTVRIIPDLKQDVEIARGDVIVTRCLDPGQTHFLMMAGALILEVGGMLSHGAILARELGVPTVAQVNRATERFVDGQEVVVNGTKGEIVLVDVD